MAYSNTNRAEVTACVERAQAGDDRALEQLYRMYSPRLTSWLWRQVDRRYDAESIAQDTFITVLEKIGTLEQPVAFESWLYRIARRKLINYLQRVKRPQGLLEFPAQTPTSLEIVLTKEKCRHVKEGIRQLSELDRDTLHRFYFRGDPIRKMAADLNKPDGTIKRRLHVARKRLAVLLTEN